MSNVKNNSRQQSSETPTCKTCKYYLGLHPARPEDEGAPFAWCDPYFNNRSIPCIPWEDASKKSCYKAKHSSV